MKWFALRKSSHEQLAVSMAGIKLGDRLLVVGCSDPMLIAQLAVKTGLTGRAFAVDVQEPAVTSAAAIAAREGALVETATTSWSKLPLETDSFDVAIVRDVLAYLAAGDRSQCLREVRRVLRAGGRCLIIDGKGRGRAVGRSGSVAPDYASEDGPIQALSAEGFKAARILAERDGLRFAEAVKPNVER
jgi:ubiquinone/menaquinone biosynthesis C-methylase UbiE